ncbi:uncharacterized protein LOC129771269 [Toxorhynchites rutilus septentrionalis]|uniref:uncharacterized protein LOC129771269 n=1 Tax=Toxorhynchites rutilus septentrionalis TaxID=329112 RepID=UPI00247AEA5E|nr:uncharacterized protein LOC129771269 [Toxorhynchites rutilus septentrionalis]
MDKDTSRFIASDRTLDELRLQNARNEKLLRDFGIDLSNLGDAAQEVLENYAKIKHITSLTELDPSIFAGYCYEVQCKRLEARFHAITLKADIKRLKNEIKREECDLAKLEQFVAETRSQLIPSEEMEKTRIMREKRIEMLRSKQKTLLEKVDAVNLDELIAKVNALEAEENT